MALGAWGVGGDRWQHTSWTVVGTGRDGGGVRMQARVYDPVGLPVIVGFGWGRAFAVVLRCTDIDVEIYIFLSGLRAYLRMDLASSKDLF